MASAYRADTEAFAKTVLGYQIATGQASRTGMVKPVANKAIPGIPAIRIVGEMNPDIYCVESPDGLTPASRQAEILCRYSDSNIPAGIAYEGKGYRCASYGFPIEAIHSTETINQLISNTLEYLKK